MKPQSIFCLLLCMMTLVTASLADEADKTVRLRESQNARSGASRGERYALLVGIDTYRSSTNPIGITPLRYCGADVKAFYDVLTDPAIGGFKPENVDLMTDSTTGNLSPTNTNIIARLETLAKRLNPQDTFIFYFSGHGMTRRKNAFLLAANSNITTLNTLEVSAIPLEMVQRILSKIAAHQILLIIDACRNDPEASKSSGMDNLLNKTFTEGLKLATKKLEGRPSVTATLYACELNQRAYEWPQKKHSVFSYYLIEGLKGKAPDSAGKITVASLAKYTQEKVLQWARENLPENRNQTPWLVQEGGAELILVSSAPANPPDGTVSEEFQLQRRADFERLERIFLQGKATPDPNFRVALRLNREVYRHGDEAVLSITPTSDGYLSVFHIGSDKTVTQFYPLRGPDNADLLDPSGKIGGKRTVNFPAAFFQNQNRAIFVELSSDQTEDFEAFLVIVTADKIDLPNPPTIEVLRQRLMDIPLDKRALKIVSYQVKKR
jgi:uncharacterized caspase-like protein